MSYRLSFGSNRLLVNECGELIALYHEHSDWEVVKTKAIQGNILSYSTNSSLSRVVHELCVRLKSLTNEELNFFSNADLQDQTILCWVAVCRTYKVIADYTEFVILESFYNYKETLEPPSFEFFIENQKSTHAELNNISDIYINTMTRVLFHMLKQVKILSEKNELLGVLPSDGLLSINQMSKNDAKSFLPMR